MSDPPPLAALPPEARSRLRKRPMPRWLAPMLATLTEDRFSDPRWIFEPKFDGVRCLVFRDRRGVRLLSRNKLTLNRQYPEIEEAFRAMPAAHYVVDGEIVAFEGKRTSFARLQRRMQLRDPDRAKGTRVAVYIYVFDVVYANGFDLTRLPLLQRKLVLRRLVSFNRRVRFTAHRVGEGEQAWRDACANGLEGVIAKRAESHYEHGRSRDWLKFKCVNEQELVIGGWTDPAGARSGLGALLLGYYDDGSLVYAGKVGTGFDERTLKLLSTRLASRRRALSPFARGRIPGRGVHWVRPDLVAQIGFTEWTRDGQLRHPRFLGLRTDKAAKDVVREVAKS